MKALLNITPIFLAPLANSFNTIKTTTTTTKNKTNQFSVSGSIFFSFMSSAEGCGHQLFQFVFYRHTQPIQLFICKKKSISVGEAAEALKAVLPRGCSQFVSLESTR